jgi:intracellular septation protein A
MSLVQQSSVPVVTPFATAVPTSAAAQAPTQAPTQAATTRPRPRLRTVLRRVGLSLTVACAVPAALFFTSYQLFGVWPAIVVALLWSYGAIAWRAVTGRRTSGLLVLTAIVLTARTAVTLAAHSTFFYFLQPIITDGVVAATFLLSLATARPVVARLAGDFYPMDAELSMRPRMRRLFWRLTAMWAVVCLGKAVAMFWALNSLSLDTFVLVKSISMPASNLMAVAATVCAAVIVGRKEGLLGVHARPVPVAA